MKGSELKEKIIETASFLFYKNGYNATGINEIIAKSGIAKATLYNHFKSKEDICLSYLEFMNSKFLLDINEFCLAHASGTKQVLGIFDFLQKFFLGKDFNGCWCIKTVSEIPKENQKIRTEIQRQKNLFIQFISDLIKSNNGSLKANEVKNMARRIYLLYESAVAESHLHQKDWPIKEAKKLASLVIN